MHKPRRYMTLLQFLYCTVRADVFKISVPSSGFRLAYAPLLVIIERVFKAMWATNDYL